MLNALSIFKNKSNSSEIGFPFLPDIDHHSSIEAAEDFDSKLLKGLAPLYFSSFFVHDVQKTDHPVKLTDSNEKSKVLHLCRLALQSQHDGQT
jgi:hypothetical protein